MVMVYVPTGVVPAVDIVSVELKPGVPEDGLKVAVTPAGRPEADRVTVSPNVSTRETDTVVLTDSPCTAEPEVGLTEMLKSGAAVTVSWKVVLCVFPPPVPVRVMVYVPMGVVAAVEIVRVEVNDGVPEDGLKVAVTPVGRPDADRVTTSLKPSIDEMETVAVVDSPCVMESEVGLTEMLKSGTGAATTVSRYVQLCVFPPPLPVIFTVYLRTGVVVAADIVSLDVKSGVPETGVKVAVTPAGRPEADKLTVLVKSSLARTDTVALTDSPCTAEPEVGLTEMLKSGAAVTVSWKVVVCVFPPPVPVIVILYVPAGVVVTVKIVRAELKSGTPEDGSKVAVAPAGRPEAERLTRSLNPPIAVTDTIAPTQTPCTTSAELGVTEMLKSGTGGMAVTVSSYVQLRVSPPPVPVRVMV